jgi:hypothetical protein
MSRFLSTKLHAARIDPSYVRRPDSLRRFIVIVGFLCCLGALATWLVAEKRSRSAMYSPGAVATVHATWGANCSSCHDADGRGGFSRSVSDGACLKCHDGPIHHPNQTTMIGSDRNGHTFAGSCASCHVEHRGHAALVASSNLTCLQCHADLSGKTSHTQPPDAVRHPPPPMTVTAFDLAHHPSFGRTLTPESQPVTAANWVDPTHLAFHHKTHLNGGDEFDLKKIDPAAVTSSMSGKCVVCHRLQPRVSGIAAPTLAMADGRYMQPNSYAANCAACHDIKFEPLKPDLKPALVADALPHADLATVREEIRRRLSGSLSAATFEGPPPPPAEGQPSADDKPDPFHRNKPKPPAETGKVDLFHHKPAAPQPPAAATISRDEWVRRNTIFLLGKIDQFHAPSFPKFEGTIPGTDAVPPDGDPPKLSDDQFVEIYLAAVVLNQCNKCHSIAGNFPSLRGEASGEPLRIVLTGLAPTPRKWFINSRFDHRAHRNLNCIDCHSRAPETDDDRQVLLPNIADPLGHDISCTQCHHETTASSGSASLNCTTCHLFHDRSRERTPDRSVEMSGAGGTQGIVQ